MKRHIKNNYQVLYTDLLLTGELSIYLIELDEEMNRRSQYLIEELVERSTVVTEELKTNDQIRRVQEMNNISNCANEIISEYFNQ